MSVSNINFGIHTGVTQAHKKCVKKIKERKKRQPHKKFFNDRKDFVWLLQNLDVTNVDELHINNSSHTKDTICLVNE